jgi:hypothetical protein
MRECSTARLRRVGWRTARADSRLDELEAVAEGAPLANDRINPDPAKRKRAG